MNPVAIARYYFAVRDDQITPDEEGMEAKRERPARLRTWQGMRSGGPHDGNGTGSPSTSETMTGRYCRSHSRSRFTSTGIKTRNRTARFDETARLDRSPPRLIRWDSRPSNPKESCDNRHDDDDRRWNPAPCSQLSSQKEVVLQGWRVKHTARCRASPQHSCTAFLAWGECIATSPKARPHTQRLRPALEQPCDDHTTGLKEVRR
jgi:hypothetical protein